MGDHLTYKTILRDDTVEPLVRDHLTFKTTLRDDTVEPLWETTSHIRPLWGMIQLNPLWGTTSHHLRPLWRMIQWNPLWGTTSHIRPLWGMIQWNPLWETSSHLRPLCLPGGLFKRFHCLISFLESRNKELLWISSVKKMFLPLTHWGRVTHICVSKLTIIGSDNGLSPGRRQAIIWTSAGILLIGSLGTNFSEILIGIQTFSFKKMQLKMSSAKWRPFCLGLNVLIN